MAEAQRRPDNKTVANILADIADMLEVKGETLFKILAYRKAAGEIATLGRDVAEYVEQGTLTELPGVGKSIAEKVREIVETGTTGVYEELKQSFPPSLVTLMEIQGLGPKKAKVLYDEIGICSLEALEEAVREHRLRDLKGFGPKTEDNIQRGIELYRMHHERLPLSEAFPAARRLMEELARTPEVLEADMSGSLRRMRETIGDIDLLAASTDPAVVTEAFASLPEVDHVLAKGPSKTSVVLRTGIQVDLRVVAPESWGAALQYFTGNKEHNVKLRERAKDLGYKLNEYGVFRLSDGQRVASETEEEVYEELGLDFILPTMRLGKGEIEAAMTHRLPRVVTVADMRGDLHVHTRRSDGRDGLDRLYEKATALGYSYLAITDHAEQLKIAGGLTAAELEESIKEIDTFNRDHPGFRFLSGAELNIGNEGQLDYPDELLGRLDVVVASVHSGFAQDREQLTARTISAVDNPHVDVIAHPTGRILGKREPFDVDICAVIEAAARTGTALELNSFPDRLDLRDEHLRMAKEAGAKIAIDTDAHAVDQLEYMFYGVATAQRAWLEPADVLNAWSLEQVLDWLER